MFNVQYLLLEVHLQKIVAKNIPLFPKKLLDILFNLFYALIKFLI